MLILAAIGLFGISLAIAAYCPTANLWRCGLIGSAVYLVAGLGLVFWALLTLDPLFFDPRFTWKNGELTTNLRFTGSCVLIALFGSAVTVWIPVGIIAGVRHYQRPAS